MYSKIITCRQEFKSLHLVWNQLLDVAHTNNLYLSWEWLYTWWQMYGIDRELFIICTYEENQLIAIFPLFKHLVKKLYLFKWSVLEFLGSGEHKKDEVCSNLLEPIVHPDYIEAYFIHLRSFLYKSEVILCNQIVLKSVRTDTFFLKKAMFVFNENTYHIRVLPLFTNGATRLESGWDCFMKKLGKKTRKKIRRERRLLESTDAFEYFFLENESDFDWMFDAFVKLSLKRWKGRGVFSSQRYLEFQRCLAKRLFRKGLVRLSLMKVKDRIIAGNLDYCYGDTVFGYQTAFDIDFDSKASIGMQGILYCLERAIKEGYRIYDWYRIEPGDYKRHFVSDTEQIVELLILKRDIVGYLIILFHMVIRTVKRSIKAKKQFWMRSRFYRYAKKTIQI